MPVMSADATTDRDDVGALVRHWRLRRRLSQQALSDRCGVSTRHLSYIETGRSNPSTAMISQLGRALDVPLREQRRMVTAAGFAPRTTEHPLTSPALQQVNSAVEAILAGHEPFPALVIDGGWDLVAANDAVYRLLDGVPAHLLMPPVNVVRLSLEPDGLGSSIVDLDQWRAAILTRIQHEHEATGDARLAQLLADFPPPTRPDPPDIVLTLRMRLGDDVLSFVTTTTVFGTPGDVTVAELAIEALYPADDATRAALLASGTKGDDRR